ncbi:hypothetical protein J6590_051772 [Homalodisca vitripennis]|nr:hypothetical protein J6590_051772 [Homalodisca vitripennis]
MSTHLEVVKHIDSILQPSNSTGELSGKSMKINCSVASDLSVKTAPALLPTRGHSIEPVVNETLLVKWAVLCSGGVGRLGVTRGTAMGPVFFSRIVQEFVKPGRECTGSEGVLPVQGEPLVGRKNNTINYPLPPFTTSCHVYSRQPPCTSPSNIRRGSCWGIIRYGYVRYKKWTTCIERTGINLRVFLCGWSPISGIKEPPPSVVRICLNKDKSVTSAVHNKSVGLNNRKLKTVTSAVNDLTVCLNKHKSVTSAVHDMSVCLKMLKSVTSAVHELTVCLNKHKSVTSAVHDTSVATQLKDMMQKNSSVHPLDDLITCYPNNGSSERDDKFTSRQLRTRSLEIAFSPIRTCVRSFWSDMIFLMGKVGVRDRLPSRSTRRNSGHCHVSRKKGKPTLEQPLQSKQAEGGAPLCLGWQELLAPRERTPSTPTVISHNRLNLSNHPCTPES